MTGFKRSPFDIQRSHLDESRFGVRTARAMNFQRTHLKPLLAFCRAQRVRFCIVRCSGSDLSAAQTLEAQGFRLMDTLIYFGGPLRGMTRTRGGAPGIRIRPLQHGEEAAVRRVAERAFKNHPNHYFHDPRLSKSKTRLIYPDWAYREASHPDKRHGVLVAEQAGRIVGFLTLQVHSGKRLEGVLFAVDPQHQGRHIGRTLMQRGQMWGARRGARDMFIATQISNHPSQRAWIQAGLIPLETTYTFHKWF